MSSTPIPLPEPERQALRRLLAQRRRHEAAVRLRGQAPPPEQVWQTRALAALEACLTRQQPGFAAAPAESAALLRAAELLEHLGLLPPLPEPVRCRQQARARVLTRLLSKWPAPGPRPA
ncbi:hypothetical protein [Solirubrum puertoriconensis]|uniref:Uncharacterized protein n=1 Tax=Solirubrum puertoriconensis TaxID=1751427 RepID=A0A9X0L5W1_SOLP1|nr:hypothetical protein [Solirubrum puertoriconensis]KUG09173.1 hypothetical protein ASU33_20385 [Solirubrum puertoriconensis]